MEYIKSLGVVFNESFSGVWGLFANFVPTLILAIVLFIVGMLIASIVGKAVAQVINTLKINKLFESAGVETALAKMDIKLNVGKFFGVIVKWFIAIIFLIASLQIVKLSEVSNFIGQMVLSYLPKIVIAIIAIFIATIIADAVKNIVVASAKAANIASANALGSIAKYAIWIFAIMIILPEFGIAETFLTILFGGIVAIIAIAGGLAFGLGGKEAAARAIENISKDLSSK